MQWIITLVLVLASVHATAQLLPQQPQKRLAAGAVNGDTIWLDEYSREVGRLTEYASQRGDVDPSDIMQQAWTDLVNRRLMLQEASRRKIDLQMREIDSILLDATPEFVKRGLVDEKGKFNRPLLAAMLRNPDSLIKVNTEGLSEQQRNDERVQLTASIAQLRERIGLMELERRLRANIAASVPFDTTGLRQRFVDAATSATADVILVPCRKDLPQPTVTELQAYHTTHAADFATPKPMRRIAFLWWPMQAAPVDSTLFLNNVKNFVGLLNNARTSRQRDSIWTSVATTTSSGALRLSPDSTDHAQFYAAVKGKKPGTAVGPIMHPTGAHVLLVDTVHTKKPHARNISVRVIVSEIEPSRQTVDSILSQVDDAADLYEQGLELGAIAGRFGRTIEVSRWFTDDEKLFGSHRLVDVAFRTQVAAACDPIDTPERGIVLPIVTDSVPAGPMPFEAAVPQIADAINRQRGCADRLPVAKSVRGLASRLDDGRLMLAENVKEAQIARGLSVFADGMIGEVLYDPTAAREILAKPVPDLYGPFLGESGWYVVNITGVVKANPEEFPMWLELRKEDLEQEQRAAAWDKLQTSLRTAATITDNRWMYFRY